MKIDGFTIRCKKCDEENVVVKGTAIRYGVAVRVMLVCLVPECEYREEIPVVQTSFHEFRETELQKEEL